MPRCGFLKNEEKTSKKLAGLSCGMAKDVSNFGVTKKFDRVSNNIKKAVQVMVMDHALVLSP